MKATELRSKDMDGLKAEHLELLLEQFKLRMQNATGQLRANHQLKANKRNIARVLTILSEKKRGDQS